MKRDYNFSAGPAMLPLPVLEAVQAEWLDWQGTGVSIAEVSHRTTKFREFVHDTEQKLRALLTIPDEFDVLFLSGGARIQFALLPQNVCAPDASVDCLVSGFWSDYAAKEMRKQVAVNVVADNNSLARADIPTANSWRCNPDSDFFYYASNETIDGIAIVEPPSVSPLLVADMTSDILSRPIDFSHFGAIFASAQKQMGIAGICLLIIRRSWLERARASTPIAFDYTQQAAMDGLLVTPPTVAWYIAGKMFDWTLAQGGVKHFQQVNQQKADCLYQLIDNTALYHNPVAKPHRSNMNVVFDIKKPDLQETFLQQAAGQGLLNLKGHSMRGGCRASLYNAMPLEGVTVLCDFMQDFANQYG